jgi:hypothetical protein
VVAFGRRRALVYTDATSLGHYAARFSLNLWSQVMPSCAAFWDRLRWTFCEDFCRWLAIHAERSPRRSSRDASELAALAEPVEPAVPTDLER